VSEFIVAIGSDPALLFERPRAVLRAPTAAEAPSIFDDADAALRDGYWIAGVLAYEGGATLGIFDSPVSDVDRKVGPFEIGRSSGAFDRSAYDLAIATISRAIYEGDVYQVNYTVPFDFAFDGDPYALYLELAQSTRAPYAAYARDDERHVVSLSPELFLSIGDERVTTKPMKGTAQLDRARDLTSPKNRAEHVMIVDLLRNDLRRVCRRVNVETLFEVERYPTFATMTSTVVGSLPSDVPLSELFRATFPCGSITGAPKRAAMSQIARLERRERGAYCGSVGFLSPERRGWWNVAIRTAQIDTSVGTGRFDAGGGIVADSNADDEWCEVLLKARFFLEFCRAIHAIETFAGGDPEARDLHLERLRRTVEHLGGTLDEPALRAQLEAVDVRGTIVRILAYDGGTHVVAGPLERPEEPVSICLSDERVSSADPNLSWKTTWRPHFDRAAARAKERGCFDALLRNERDELTEGARTNLFVRLDGKLITPPLSGGLLPGILRARLLASGEAVERTVTVADLTRAPEIFVGNSARGMLRARLVEP
jgi:para-aminobenzoate synthetase/4-amino-4-deoxychorismate lyase